MINYGRGLQEHQAADLESRVALVSVPIPS